MAFWHPTRSDDDHSRIRHGHGHTQEEMFAIKYGNIGRVPDIVVFPTSEEQVTSLITAAGNYNVKHTFGGGTNVTEAVRCSNNADRMIALWTCGE